MQDPRSWILDKSPNILIKAQAGATVNWPPITLLSNQTQRLY
jgi:hypothetical protein